MLGYGGECQSYGTSTSYLVWQNIWRGFFQSGPGLVRRNKSSRWSGSYPRSTRRFSPVCRCWARSLNLQIPDNELTRSFDAKLRKSPWNPAGGLPA